MNVNFPKLISSAAALFAIGASLYAQETASSTSVESLPLCQTFEQGYPLESDKYSAAFSAPARWQVQTSWDVFLTGSFTYWYADQDGMELAYPAIFSGNTPLGSDQGEYLVQEFNYHPGFKVGLGMNFNNDHWLGFIEYTWVRQIMNVGATVASDPREGTPFWSLSSWLVSNGTPLRAEQISSSWKLNIDLLDATLSRPFYQGQKLTILPFGGIRAAWIRQYLLVDTAAYDYSADPVVLAPSHTQSHNRSHCWSMGPRVGLQGHWLLDWGFRLESDIAGSVLYSCYTTVAINNEPFPGASANGVQLKNVNTIRPMADMSMGLGWGSYFDRQNYHLDLLATYDFNMMWGQNMMRSLADAANQAVGHTAPDLHLQGLTLTLRLISFDLSCSTGHTRDVC